MTYNNRSNSDNKGNQENIFSMPEDREGEDYQLHKLTVKIILSNEELKRMKGKLPSSRVVSYVVNGTPVEETQELYRVDALGRIVPAGDVSGVSWGTGEAIPSDCRACCLNPFEFHDFRLVHLYRDGHITTKGNILCTECWDWQKKRIFWKTILLFGLLYNPEIY